MKNLARVLLLLSFLSTLITAQTNKPKNQSKADAPGNANFLAMADQFVKDSLALSPVSASQAGYHKHRDAKTGKIIMLDAELDDVGAKGMAAQLEFYRDWRRKFQKQTPVSSLNAQDAADYRLIDDQVAVNLLELEHIQNYKHNPTVFVELLGNGLFLPMTQEYAPKDIRVGDVISRIGQIPRFLDQAKSQLLDADPIFISTAIGENQGNVDMVDGLASDIPVGSPLRAQYDKVAPPAKKALSDFSDWMKNDLAKRPTNGRTWRLGEEWYALKFRYVIETSIEPARLLADAEAEIKRVRADMLRLALPLYKEMYPGQEDYSNLPAGERENKIIGAVLDKISQEHPQRDQLMDAIKGDLAGITQFIRDKKIAKAESKLHEYNNYTLKWLSMHEALPGHYVQAEHANDVQPSERRLLRNLFANGPYVEGWAEYIADVMTQAGYLDSSPKFRIVRLKIWLRAVANTILDVRLQTMNMTDQQALDLMMHDTFQTQAEAEGKLIRAKLSSTQLPTYFAGNRQWWTLRKKYEAAKGSAFTLEEFHDRALDQGPLPLEYLEKIILPEKVN